MFLPLPALGSVLAINTTTSSRWVTHPCLQREILFAHSGQPNVVQTLPNSRARHRPLRALVRALRGHSQALGLVAREPPLRPVHTSAAWGQVSIVVFPYACPARRRERCPANQNDGEMPKRLRVTALTTKEICRGQTLESRQHHLL